MKNTGIECKFVDRYLFVLVHTDEGVTGLGESGAWVFLEASAAVVETFKRYLIGKDPLKIEHHWQFLYRAFHFRGAAIMGTLSAIDIALWDIAGKYRGVPCYALMSGKTRDKARVYCHVYGDSREKLVQGCLDAKAKGFTAIGHLTFFSDTPRTEREPTRSYSAKLNHAIESVFKYREAVEDEVDLCIEIHRRLSVPEAIALGRAIESCRPYFYEDPVKPDKGYLVIPDSPGIGVELAEDAEEPCPYIPREYVAKQHEDGSVVDV